MRFGGINVNYFAENHTDQIYCNLDNKGKQVKKVVCERSKQKFVLYPDFFLFSRWGLTPCLLPINLGSARISYVALGVPEKGVTASFARY